MRPGSGLISHRGVGVAPQAPPWWRSASRRVRKRRSGSVPTSCSARRYATAASSNRPDRRSSSARVPCSRCDRSMTPDRSTASARARPASGPSAMATATARFSVTTADGRHPLEHPVQRRDLRPVGLVGRRSAGVQRGDRPLELVAADAASAERSVDQGRSLGDLCGVPPRPVLIGQQDQVAGGRGAGRAPAVVQQHQTDCGQHIRLVRHQVQQAASQTDRLGGQLATHQLVTVGCRVSLVEDEVDDAQHDVETVVEVCSIGESRTGCRPT